MIVPILLIVFWLAATWLDERLKEPDAVVWRDIGRLVRESKRHEVEARECVRARMRGTYAVYTKKTAR